MNARWSASLLAAVILHAFVLFGIRIQTPARPLEISDEPASMDVSLVITAPEAPVPPAPSPPPEPAPTPEPPEPRPTPEMSTPPPMEPTPAPEEDTSPESTPVAARPHSSPHHLVQIHPRPATPHSAALGAAPGGSSHAGAIGPLTSRASYVSNPRPDYPDEARRLHQQGLVILSVEVDTDGRPSDVTLTRTSGFPLLDQAAIEAVRSWRFEPARAGGIPVSSQVDVPVRFTLSQ